MAPFAALLALSAAPYAALRAQTSPARLVAATDSVPASFTARVASAVAQDWGVDPSDLVLSWGRGPLNQIKPGSAFKLLGLGDGGWLAVVLEPDSQRPQALRLRVGFTESRLVASRQLRTGTVLVESDLRREPHVHWGPPELDQQPLPQAGWIARRMIAAGEVLEEGRVVPPPVISSGDPVRLFWHSGNVQVALDGVALNDAAAGESVRVRTGRKTGVVTGTASGPGEAKVN